MLARLGKSTTTPRSVGEEMRTSRGQAP